MRLALVIFWTVYGLVQFAVALYDDGPANLNRALFCWAIATIAFLLP